MDFRPSPPQQLLVATARQFLTARCPIELVQRLASDDRGFDPPLWRAIAELGWPGPLVPAALGGRGRSRPAPPRPVAGGDSPLGKRVLPAMADGDRIATTAVVEERGSFDPDAIALACEVPGRLSGEKLFVRGAHLAA